MNLKTILKDDKGLALFIALMLTFMLSIIGIFLINTTNDEISIAGNELNEMKSFYAAESGLSIASALILTEYEATGLPPANLPDSVLVIDGVALALTTVAGATEWEVLTKGSLAGLNALTSPFTISASSYDSSHNSSMVLQQTFKIAMVPIFQFAIFYEDLMQFAPLPAMTVTGRVHSNSDMWVSSWNGIDFDGKVTTSGDINYGVQNGQFSNNGDVRFKDGSENYQSMNSGSDWLDANDTNWVSESSSRWSGKVQDDAHGINELNMPLENGAGDPHKLIERYNGGSNPDSYEEKAELKIIDDNVFYYNGAAWVNVTASMAGIITNDVSTEFVDGHEEKTIINTQIDMGLLKNSAYFPSNGIIYISDQRATAVDEMNGVTLVNAADIGNATTIVSENPLYFSGDFNTSGKQPASVIADAVTLLSNDWESTNKANSNLNWDDRLVTGATTYNVSFITGDLTPTGTNWGGGVNNLPRFLEDWNDEDCNIVGSMVCMWKSQTANGDWKYEGNPGYYSPPTRNWSFDTDLADPANLPPGAPMVRTFFNSGWKQNDIGFTLY